MTKHYLSLKEVAERLGVVPGTLTRLTLPEPDVMVGRTRGWSPQTIETWNAARPGRGHRAGKKATR